MTWFEALPTIVQWAIQGVAFLIVLTILFYAVLAGALVIAWVYDALESKLQNRRLGRRFPD